MGAALDALMHHAIDYAGIFSPAQLAVSDAIAEYERVRKGPFGRIVGTFVVSSDRLKEIRTSTIPLSVVMRQPSAASVDDVVRRAESLTIAAVEFPPVSPADIQAVAATVPSETRRFFEVSPGSDCDASLDAVAAAGAFAKIRTGGVTTAAFPHASTVYRFFRGCVDRRLPGKATAGLHHAIAGCYPLTYETGSATSMMFGFLNVSAAAALAYVGAPERDVIALLTETSSTALAIDGDALTWHEYRVSANDIQVMRRSLFCSFGSCSVQEPIDDLVRMQLA